MALDFIKSKYKSVKFNRDIHELIMGETWIKFRRGEASTMTGRVSKIHHNGVTTISEYGYYSPGWENIDRIYVKKEITRVKAKRLSVRLPIGSHIPILDGALDKIRSKLENVVDIKLTEKKTDMSTKYMRILTYKVGKEFVVLEIVDKHASSIVVTGSNIRKWTMKPNDKGTITSSQTTNAVNKVKSLL